MLDATLCKINKRKHQCLVLGDVNSDLFRFSTSNAIRDYINCLVSNNFLPCLLLPTRVTCSSSTVIDHVYFFNNNPNIRSKIQCGNIICDISDHYPNFFLLKSKTYIDMSKRPNLRVFSHSNKVQFSEKLNSIVWDEIFKNSNDVNLCYDVFIRQLSEDYNHCFPLVRIYLKAFKNKSWFSTELRNMLYEKNRLYKLWLNSVDNKDRMMYVSF